MKAKNKASSGANSAYPEASKDRQFLELKVHFAFVYLQQFRPQSGQDGYKVMPSWAYSVGTYTDVCDGASPGSPVLSDGHALYTPGSSKAKKWAGRKTALCFKNMAQLLFLCYTG